MKLIHILSLFVLFLPLSHNSQQGDLQALDVEGAWKLETQNDLSAANEGALLVKDGYIFYTEYRVDEKYFEGSLGGQYSVENGQMIFKIEFDSWPAARTGQIWRPEVKVVGNQLTFEMQTEEGKSTMTFSRIDDATGDLAGAWRITDRMRNGAMQAMRQGPRKTIKMITGTRFQWAAYNPETNQFAGTGGGTIELKDGVYTENIEFFSRNKDRVGASLSFDYKVDGIKWDHSGMSSSGNPIREIWTRQNQ